jgi:hypothetical protein
MNYHPANTPSTFGLPFNRTALPHCTLSSISPLRQAQHTYINPLPLPLPILSFLSHLPSFPVFLVLTFGITFDRFSYATPSIFSVASIPITRVPDSSVSR